MSKLAPPMSCRLLFRSFLEPHDPLYSPALCAAVCGQPGTEHVVGGGVPREGGRGGGDTGQGDTGQGDTGLIILDLYWIYTGFMLNYAELTDLCRIDQIDRIDRIDRFDRPV